MGAPFTGQLPAAARLLLLTSGKRVSQVVHLVAQLGIADHLSGGPRTVAELAEATGSHAESLARVLRASTAVELLKELPDGTYTLTPLSDMLRRDNPDSVLDIVLFNGGELVGAPLTQALHTVRTGRPAFEHIYGVPFFDYLQSHEESGALFDRAMEHMSRVTARGLAEKIQPERFSLLVDVGGGRGHFLCELLRRTPLAEGLLFDLPAVAPEAEQTLTDLGVAGRAKFVAGDFLKEVPSGGDAYVLKAVLHNWDDESALQILSVVRAAMTAGEHSRLFIAEQVIGPPNQWDHAKLLDLDMMLRFGGRERDLWEWRRLLDAAGFELLDSPSAGAWSVLECRRTS
ncbi:acetylserotonin O-methyltransferase [Sphaerisporangium corydalis]|uniref:Methyltransferase n=1 Tax=Sphaerisporangium corydalis TaxID=1441875 RepID=A0ABV9EFN5_9ACTN|nr:acetylserotonin O-methyltransferase [Sphaerisporangium corydalis]